MARFAAGKSGNPRGCPKGALGTPGRIRKQLEEAAGPIVQKLLERAAKGEPASMRLVLERLCPPARSAPISTPLSLPADPVEAAQAVLARLAAGSLTFDEGEVLLGGIKTVLAIADAAELAKRVEALENQLAKLGGGTMTRYELCGRVDAVEVAVEQARLDRIVDCLGGVDRETARAVCAAAARRGVGSGETASGALITAAESVDLALAARLRGMVGAVIHSSYTTPRD